MLKKSKLSTKKIPKMVLFYKKETFFQNKLVIFRQDFKSLNFQSLLDFKFSLSENSNKPSSLLQRIFHGFSLLSKITIPQLLRKLSISPFLKFPVFPANLFQLRIPQRKI